MATHTDYFNLEKPESYENYNIAVFNSNADTIDLQMHNNQTSAAKVMVGATSLADGESGRVPTPHAGDEDKYLKGDGTWAAGNSNVEANPSGTPTETLETIGIDNVIYQLPEGGDTEITGDEEGSVISIDDGKLNKPLKACTVDINPVQSGSGTPSPSNIRPISGWSAVEVARTGKNMLNVNSRVSQTTASVVYTSDANYIIMNGTKQGGGYADLSSLTLTLPAGTYYAKAFAISGSATSTINIYPYDGSNNIVGNILNDKKSFTLSEQKTFYFRFAVWADGSVFTDYKLGIVISTSSDIDTYEPYTGTTYPITLPSTVYGGLVDVTSGVLTVTDGYIASYDGETLPSTWISDRDVYAEGTTPTTGAEVVYKLATPTEVSLTPTEITTLYGKNVIWADSGDMAITYVRDISIAINDALNQSITPTYSSGTKIADYNIGGHTGAIYVQGAGGNMDTLWTGDVKPTSDSMPTVQLAYPLSGYDYIVVEGYGTYTYYTTDAIYKPVIGRTYVGNLNGEINYCAVVTIINDSNVQLRYWGSAGSNTNIVGIYGVKI